MAMSVPPKIMLFRKQREAILARVWGVGLAAAALALPR